MITNKELNEVSLSPTKKDYYQIWNELMELADKISERWSPASTNESDPGIVLLKALTAVADKLNYNIDKNTLEAFMPSATQEDSMRKLTEMMGYDMKHYQSATGKVTITYKSSNDTSITQIGNGIYFPKFINLKNEDEDVNYVTLEEFTLQAGQDSREIAIIEGELIECETNNDNIITALHLDDLNRYILPEYGIAENGIFITNIADSKESDLWRKEQNLNVQQPMSKVYKFGFDSKNRLPYIQFPEDIKALMEDGIKIKYIRTNGLNGNISAKILSKLEKPAIWATADTDEIKNLSADAFAVSNSSACNNGADPESLNAAYNNYKRTIGTFDTLVTCRDYMNKIYQMTESDTDTTPLVSNIIVSDIRDDINRTTPVCTFNEYGICYNDMSLKEAGENKIEHFDLMLYPFKTIYGLNNKTEYKNSFKFTAENAEKIKADLALNKTIAHEIKTPDSTDIACIKNYLKLKARVTTAKKVTLIEETEILNNIYKAIYANFNARQIDFGEEIPYESLVDVIKNADYRIKEISLDEPLLETKFSLADGTTERGLDTPEGKNLYNKLALRNVLAGKISAFEYDNDFVSEYDKTSYPPYKEGDEDKTYELVYPIEGKKIKSITSSFDVGTAFAAAKEKEGNDFDGYTLKENEVIQFRVPNFKTVKTYPAYVNYFIKLNSMSGEDAIPATFQDLNTFMKDKWDSLLEEVADIYNKVIAETSSIDSQSKFNDVESLRRALFTKADAKYTKATTYAPGATYYYLPITDDIFWALNNWVKNQVYRVKNTDGTYQNKTLEGIYGTVGVQEKPFGRLIDASQKKYLPAYKFGTVASNKEALSSFYVQDTREADDPAIGTADGLGRDSDYAGVPVNGEYRLKSNEYILFNYTDSKTDEAGVETKTVVNKVYTEGDIIRANFNLIDSALYHNNHSYSKRDGFSFDGYQPEGMFTLGTNEQIEIRDIVKVEFNESAYFYWTLNSDNPEAASNDFKFDELYNGTANSAYTLKEGEHLYYTNSKKQDLVYYGAGTLIVRSDTNLTLRKYTVNGEASEEDIMTSGLAANIPWQHYTLSKDKKLTIIENQYVSLTEGDKIISIDGVDPTTAIDNSWNTIIEDPIGTVYQLAEDEANSHLPPIAVEGFHWTVRSRLDFNMSKTTAQPLNCGDKLTITYTDNNTTILEPKEINEEFVPMYINSNYTCQAATDTLDFTQLIEAGLDLKLKISSQSAPAISDHEDLNLNNYINGDAKYTKFDFANLPKPKIPSEEEWLSLEENTEKTSSDYLAWKTSMRLAFKLNISIPKDNFGLLAIYYIKDIDEAADTGAYLKAKDESGNVENLEFFNSGSSTSEDTLSLKDKLNIIKVSPEVKQLEIYADENKKSTIVFGNLDLIKDINPKLDYRITDDPTDEGAAKTTLAQLLKDIKNSGVAKDFYYNVPIQRSNEIDLNPAVEDDTLSNPLAWYDPNNVNRKFVISEINADYLSTGIILTKSSRV